MKRTQKALAAVTALALAASLAVPVLAVDHADGELIDKDNSSAKHTVTATYTPTATYHLDISWGSMEFTYNPGTWNPEYQVKNSTVMGYVGDDTGWVNNDENVNGITLTNKSNKNLKVTFAFESNDDRVSGQFYDSNLNNENKRAQITEKGIWMERADANITGTALNKSVTSDNPESIGSDKKGIVSIAKILLVLSGRPSKTMNAGTELGKVTITIEGTDDGTDLEGELYSKVYHQDSDAAETA